MKQVNITDIIGNSSFDDKQIIQAHNSGLILIMDDMGRVYDETWRYIADGVIKTGCGIGSDGYDRPVHKKKHETGRS